MPDSNNPQNPNFQPGVGRLVTDRFDFQNHIDGNSFRHQASQIDLNPVITINGSPATNMQDAIVALKAIVEPPTIQFATATTPGIVQLAPAGDVQGTYNTMRVFGIRGYPINTTPPSINNVLTWNGSAWGPAPSQGVFTPAGDLMGNSTSQQVVNLSGNGGEVTISASELAFNNIVHNPVITQLGVNGTNGTNLIIEAQGVESGTGNGGNIYLFGGHQNGGGSLTGGVSLSLGGSPLDEEGGAFVLQATQVISGNKVVAFFPSSATGLTSTDMGSNTGNKVIYIGDAATPPTNSSPTGSILWSQSGQLHVMQESGSSFIVGSLTNPSSWPAIPSTAPFIPTTPIPTNGSISYNVTATSFGHLVTNVPATALTFPLAPSTAIYIDMFFVGKSTDGSTDSAGYYVTAAYVRNGSASPTPVPFPNPNTIIDTKVSGDAIDWTPPTTVISGNNILVQTGFFSSVSPNINWTAVIDVVIAFNS